MFERMEDLKKLTDLLDGSFEITYSSIEGNFTFEFRNDDGVFHVVKRSISVPICIGEIVRSVIDTYEKPLIRDILTKFSAIPADEYF